MPDPCPDYRHGLCLLGDGCPFAHGVYERHLHPARYRTRPCAEGAACGRRVCFFAHAPAELRAPTHEWSAADADAVRTDKLQCLAADPEGGDLAAAAAALLAGRAPPLRPLRTGVSGGGSGAASGRATPSSARSDPASPCAAHGGGGYSSGGCSCPGAGSPFGRALDSAPGSPAASAGGASGAATPLAAAASRFGPHRDGDGPRMSMAVRRQLGFAAPPPRDGSARGSARGSAAGSGAGTPRGGVRVPHHPHPHHHHHPIAPRDLRAGLRAALSTLPASGRSTPMGALSPACSVTPRGGASVGRAPATSRQPTALPPTAPGSGDLGEAVSRLGVRFSFMGDERVEDGGSEDGGLL